MRKLFLLLLFFVIIQLQAQNYHIITFSSSGATLNNIKVENLTQGTSVGLVAKDVLHLIIKTSEIREVGDFQHTLKIFPNPMSYSCNIEFSNAQQGDVRILLYDLNGKAIQNYQKELVKGRHSFNISGIAAGTYIVSVSTTADKFIAKLFVLEQIKTAGSLEYVGQRNDPIFERDEINSQTLKLNESGTRAVVEMDYYSGDKLRFIGFNSINVSDTITASPLSDTILVFSFLRFFPAVNTSSISNITASAARCGGNVIKDGGLTITSRGVVWSTKPNPTIADSNTENGNGTGSFISYLVGLSFGTTYYVRAYAINNMGISYGNEISFITRNGIATLSTMAASNIQTFSAQSGGNITDNGGDSVILRGICWSTSPNPSIANDTSVNGSGNGSFISNLTGLTYNTTYYVKAYATNKICTSYGPEISFKSRDGVISLTTKAVSNIQLYSAQSGGNITNNGGDSVTLRGICWSTSPNPTITNDTTVNGSGNGSFSANLTGLFYNTTYYVRAYALNSFDTCYGNEIKFTTRNGIATITTYSAGLIKDTSAQSGGSINDNGGDPIILRGVCFSTNPNPTTSDNTTQNGSGNGNYSSLMTGLSSGTTYYVRAYCMNSFGTYYGNQRIFTTLNPGDVFNYKTGKIWMDRNLGASRVATSSTDAQAYGDLYQWGRCTDGHEKRNSSTTSTSSSTDTPGHAKFIKGSSSKDYDWRYPHNDSLWQGANGTNNPCPFGYRLPTEEEWLEERLSWSSNDASGAFASPLKLTMAGTRHGISCDLGNVGSYAYYWSSTVDGFSSKYLWFNSNDGGKGITERAQGRSVRCIRDY